MKHTYPVSPANLVALYAVGRYCTRDVAIGTVLGSALREIRSTLSLLRMSADPLKWPERGLDDLAQLVDQARCSGLPVRPEEPGERQDVPAIVGFTVYRIVQESLTNVARHARDVTDVAVLLASSADHLDVTIDGAPVATAGGPGIGIQGMRERVAATGGRLDVAAPPSGDFRVHAKLPLKEAR